MHACFEVAGTLTVSLVSVVLGVCNARIAAPHLFTHKYACLYTNADFHSNTYTDTDAYIDQHTNT